jgi:hypothetical protein
MEKPTNRPLGPLLNTRIDRAFRDLLTLLQEREEVRGDVINYNRDQIAFTNNSADLAKHAENIVRLSKQQKSEDRVYDVLHAMMCHFTEEGTDLHQDELLRQLNIKAD